MATDMNRWSPSAGDADFRRVADYVDGRLDGPDHAAERATVVHQLSISVQARATEKWLRDLTRTARRVPLVERSPLVEQRLRHYFTRWAHAQNVLTRPVPRFTAIIVADSRLDRPLAGVRGGGTDTAVSLLYACDVGELALDLKPTAAGTVTVDGQLLLDANTESPYFGVSAVVDGSRQVTESDDLGRFRFAALDPVAITLRLDNGELEIAAKLDLSPPDAGPKI